MIDTSQIHAIIARARRRLRLQAALESATTASILALGGALVVVYLVRQQVLGETAGLIWLGACAGVILIGAVLGAIGRLPTHLVATRIDRASGLADRLSTACAFEAQLGDGKSPDDPQTEALMHAAIRDAVEATPRANVPAATPFRRPRDGRAALVFGILGLAVAGLYWPDPSAAGPLADTAALERQQAEQALAERQRLAEEDVDYTRDLLEDMRRVAQAERDPNLEEFVSEIEALLAKAELGELTKEELLEKLARAEEQFMQGAGEDMEETMADLGETGRALEKNQELRELGKAMQQGDLEAVQKELEALAQKLDSGEISPEQRQEVAKALEQAAQKFEQKQSQRDQALDKQIAEAKEQMERLEKQQEKAQDPQEKKKLTRRLENQKRQMEKLEREKEEREQSAQRRNLKSLHRNLEQASKEMRKEEGQQQQQQQRMASQDLRNAAKDAGQVDADQRKMAAQKKVASQLDDLKEAMRRAKQNGNQGPKDLFGKNQRNQDFQRRAQGQQGSRQAWRPGSRQHTSGRISQGQGQQGQQPGQQGQKPGQKPGQGLNGDSYGDQHDANVLGNPTPHAGKTQDESVSGVHGRGPSRRETILSAAQKGFSSRAYEQVYAEYKNIVEEVVRAEKVPSGYKYYVKRYFQKIKPHSMD